MDINTIKGQSRVIIEHIEPSIDNGLFYVKSIENDTIPVSAHIFADGHDIISACIIYKHQNESKWSTQKLTLVENDEWIGSFITEKVGLYEFNIEAWVDYPLTWLDGFYKKHQDGQDMTVELKDGIIHFNNLKKINKSLSKKVDNLLKQINQVDTFNSAISKCLDPEIKSWFIDNPTKTYKSTHPNNLQIFCDRKKAEFSTWYEFFPRSAGSNLEHGTFKDCEKLLPRIAELGFDVLYFPPIHPIGFQFRKGKNNTLNADANQVGSPWAVGANDKGHKDILPELGTLNDFKNFIKKAKLNGLEMAMDIAYQCSPDHPYIKQHPQWFKSKSDGSIAYAENPPKKYQDIHPIYFETEDWKALWQELLSIIIYWVNQGVKIFRIDNPHTKPFDFWQWLIAEVKAKHPDVLFLAEAFTRPKIMNRLGKIGFSQSYTYFTWRVSKTELETYINELTNTDAKWFFRPNFWPNTPDINPYHLQNGHENAFIIRYILAATLSSNYGMYGPAYEYYEHQPIPGKEEYWNSEKFEIKDWDWDKSTKLSKIIKLVNQIRNTNDAFQQNKNIKIVNANNNNMMAFIKKGTLGADFLIIINLEIYNTQHAHIQLPLHELGIENGLHFVVKDELTGHSYLWNQSYNYVELNPFVLPFHIFKIVKS